MEYRDGDEHNIHADMPEEQHQSAEAQTMAMLQAAKQNLLKKTHH